MADLNVASTWLIRSDEYLDGRNVFAIVRAGHAEKRTANSRQQTSGKRSVAMQRSPKTKTVWLVS